jgi:DNA invertase Pin-like site-specific DNA recombinase
MSSSSDRIQRNIALCYIRQSFTRDDSDLRSANHQRASILAVCEENGWIPEWYQDTRHYKTAVEEYNRPAWMELKKRLQDRDVIALIAYDLSRIHRNRERMVYLIDYTTRHGIHLVVARKDQQIDFSTPEGRLRAQYIAKLDQWVSEDASNRMKEQLAYLKSAGQVIGALPFGTIRDIDGALQPTPEGVWLLPDGSFQTGIKNFNHTEEQNGEVIMMLANDFLDYIVQENWDLIVLHML